MAAHDAAVLIPALVALLAAGPPQQWPPVKPGIWMVTGRQTPTWEAGRWKGPVRACERTEILFTGKLEGELTALDPRQRCSYSSVRLSATSFEITAACPIPDGPLKGTPGIIRTRVTMRGDREFWLKSEKTWPNTGDRPEVHFELQSHGTWSKYCDSSR